MLRHGIAAAGILAASFGAATAQEVTPEVVDSVTEMLADMDCQMAPEDIVAKGGGYVLDDVICEGGVQYDITLDGEMNIIDQREE